jgi:hypothetical protein
LLLYIYKTEEGVRQQVGFNIFDEKNKEDIKAFLICQETTKALGFTPLCEEVKRDIVALPFYQLRKENRIEVNKLWLSFIIDKTDNRAYCQGCSIKNVNKLVFSEDEHRNEIHFNDRDRSVLRILDLEKYLKIVSFFTKHGLESIIKTDVKLNILLKYKRKLN